MSSRAAYIRELSARGISSSREIADACVQAGHARPVRQAVHEALKPLSTRKAGRPRTKVHVVDTVRELLAAYSKARSRVTITERMRNALNVLEAQIEEYDRLKDKNDPLRY